MLYVHRLSIFGIRMLVPGFEPGSKPREGFMMGHYTIRATGHRLVTCIYCERVNTASHLAKVKVKKAS